LLVATEQSVSAVAVISLQQPVGEKAAHGESLHETPSLKVPVHVSPSITPNCVAVVAHVLATIGCTQPTAPLTEHEMQHELTPHVSHVVRSRTAQYVSTNEPPRFPHSTEFNELEQPTSVKQHAGDPSKLQEPPGVNVTPVTVPKPYVVLKNVALHAPSSVLSKHSSIKPESTRHEPRTAEAHVAVLSVEH
jgi:hypothetical protein